MREESRPAPGLTALAGFFESCWSQPSARLTVAARAFVLNEAGERVVCFGVFERALSDLTLPDANAAG
jgi:hypothetical protein